MKESSSLGPQVIAYVTANGSITNRECRKLLGISYDHAIALLGELTKIGSLERIGVSSGTRYVLGTPSPEVRGSAPSGTSMKPIRASREVRPTKQRYR